MCEFSSRAEENGGNPGEAVKTSPLLVTKLILLACEELIEITSQIGIIYRLSLHRHQDAMSPVLFYCIFYSYSHYYDIF